MNGETQGIVRRRKWRDEPLVLFVEGYSDVTFYTEVMEHVGHSNRCFIQDLGGKGRNKLREAALLLLKPDNLARMEAVGVLLDADEDQAGAFHLASAALREAVNVQVSQPGVWVSAQGIQARFGIFVVGGPDQNGEIESLAWSAWKGMPRNAALGRCIEEYERCVRGGGCGLKSVDKFRIGALLSVLNEDDPRLGPGARARLFDFDAPEFNDLCGFLRNMAS